MILIADSGSTKADWVYGSNSNQEGAFETKGMNPFFHDYNFILSQLNSNKNALEIKDKIKEVYFFGAGCSSPDRNKIIRDGLKMFFSSAKVLVDHDMLGCAISVCDGKPGVACILGTGSNICYFDGKNISETRHGLGFILGDEGSGSYYGRKLLSSFLYKNMPSELEKEFYEKYKLGKEDIISKVYHGTDVNVFLASFAKFLSDHAKHDFIRDMVRKGMTEFFDTNVLSYKESSSVPVHFVGSIAWYFNDILHEVAVQKKVMVGKVIQKPVSGLAAYFLAGGKMP